MLEYILILDDGFAAKKSEIDTAADILKREVHTAKVTVYAEQVQSQVNTATTYVATADNFQQKNAEFEGNSNAFDYDGLKYPDAKEALQEKRQMIFVSLISENAKPISDEYGVSPIVGTQKSLEGTQEFWDNCGADVKCHQIEEVILVPNSVYADEGANGGQDANDFLDTGNTPGSWIDQQLTELAAKHGIPRENLFMVFYTQSTAGGGAAWTNYDYGPGYTIDTETALKPGNGRKPLQREIGVHETGKMIANTSRTQSYNVPTDASGNPLYDFRFATSDPIFPIKIATCGDPGAPLTRRIPSMPRKLANGNDATYPLVDLNTGDTIHISLGGDLWHDTDWRRAIDAFTTSRIDHSATPEAIDVSYGDNIAITDLIANDPSAENIYLLADSLPSYLTHDGDSIIVDWEYVLSEEVSTGSFSYLTLTADGVFSQNIATASLTFYNKDGFTVDVATIDTPATKNSVYPNPWDGKTPLRTNIDVHKLSYTNISIFDIKGKKVRQINGDKLRELRLSNGVYIMQIDASRMIKIVVKH